MWDNYVGRAIRRGNRNLLLVNALFLALFCLLAYQSQRYIYNCWNGPFPTTKEEISAVQDPSRLRNYFVKVAGLETIRTGITFVRTSHGTSRTEYEFLVGRLAEKNLLVKNPVNGEAVPDSALPTAFEGGLRPIEPEVRRKLTELLRDKSKSLDDVLLPFQLDATPFRDDFYAWLAIGIPGGLLTLFNVILALRRMSDLRAHPAIANLERFGPPELIAGQLDQEVRSPVATPTKASAITQTFLLHRTAFGLKVMRLSDILWAYQKMVQHRTYFIPTHKKYFACMLDRFGKKIAVPGSKQNTLQLLAVLAGQAPWIAIGYSAELKKLSRNLSEFAAAIDHNRAKGAGV